MDLEINILDPGEISIVAKLTARAMHTDPLHVAAFQGTTDDTLSHQVAMFQVFYETFAGEVLVARDGKRIVGVTGMCISPKCQKTPEEVKQLQPRFREALGDFLPRINHWLSVWAHNDPSEPHWHLGPVAVLPEFQGQGIGSQLIEHFCTQVDLTHYAAYLETVKEENVRLYKRFGFQLIGTEDIFGIQSKFMWRPEQKIG